MRSIQNARSGRAIRVATLNIWNRCGPWEERLVAIRKVLAELSPDVIGMQEVLRPSEGTEGPDQAAMIADGLGYHIASGSARFEAIQLGNAIFSKFPIVRSEVMTLPHGDTTERRCLVYAALQAGNEEIPFFCTHLNWKLHEGHVRELQVRALTDHVKRLAPIGSFPPIVVGDFNADPESDEIRFMRGHTSLGGKRVYFADCFAVSGEGSGITWHNRNPFAAQTHEPDRRIDYVFVRGPDQQVRGKPLSARVCFDQEIDGVYPSDHFGVMAEISLGP